MIKVLRIQKIEDKTLVNYFEVRKEFGEDKEILTLREEELYGEDAEIDCKLPVGEDGTIPEFFPLMIVSEEKYKTVNDFIDAGYDDDFYEKGKKVEKFPVYLKIKDPHAGKKTTEEIITMFHCQRTTATNWAAKNGVESVILPSGKAGFAWTDDDIEKFKNRPKRGRRWNKE